MAGVSVAERLERRLVRQPGGCLEWTGYTNKDGYGKIRVKGKSVGTHRVAWEIAHGPIPEGQDVLHHCDNPPCCDTVTCLFLGTNADNVADKMEKGRWRSGMGSHNAAKTHCPDNHAYDDANTILCNGKRQCRTCRAAWARAYKQRLVPIKEII